MFVFWGSLLIFLGLLWDWLSAFADEKPFEVRPLILSTARIVPVFCGWKLDWVRDIIRTITVITVDHKATGFIVIAGAGYSTGNEVFTHSQSLLQASEAHVFQIRICHFAYITEFDVYSLQIQTDCRETNSTTTRTLHRSRNCFRLHFVKRSLYRKTTFQISFRKMWSVFYVMYYALYDEPFKTENLFQMARRKEQRIHRIGL